MFSIFFYSCDFFHDKFTSRHYALLNLTDIILSYPNYFELVSNIKLETLNDYKIFMDYTNDIFKSACIWDFMFEQKMKSKIKIIYKYFFLILLNHLNAKNIDNKIEIWKRTWITTLNKSKLYKNSENDSFPDYS